MCVDPMLPFGLRSAPKLFNAVADALEWHLRQRGVQHIIHYLDNFIVIGWPASPDCVRVFDKLNESCTYLGVPIVEHKRARSATTLTFLGNESKTITGQLWLSADKLHHLQTLLREWGDRKACSRRELESLVGLLNHACKVVRAERSYNLLFQDYTPFYFMYIISPTDPIYRDSVSLKIYMPAIASRLELQPQLQ